MTSADRFLSASLDGLMVDSGSRLRGRLEAAVAGEYDIVREIGRGGMGVVFLARDRSLERDVAIKVLRADLFSTTDTLVRFKREARTAAALGHPNIVTVHAVREQGDLVFFVMEYIEGSTLKETVVRQGPMALPQAIEILTQIGSALQLAHDRGVVHRDVKPSNIIVDEHGWAFITDFGIAKVQASDDLTMTGAMVGTPAYASPEQCTGDPASPASDQYSLGVVAYELLTGAPPFEATTVGRMIQHHLTSVPKPIRHRRRDCPEGLAAAVMRMIAKRPGDRWPTISDALAACRADLRSVAGATDPTVAATLPAGPLASSGMRRAMRPVLAALALVGLLGAGAVVLDAPVISPPPVASMPAPVPTRATPAGVTPAGGATPAHAPAPARAVPVGPRAPRAPAELPVPAPASEPSGIPGELVLGTRGVSAVLYVNGVAKGAISRLRQWEVAPGTAHLSIRAEGCASWDSTLVIRSGAHVRVGYRHPDCRITQEEW